METSFQPWMVQILALLVFGIGLLGVLIRKNLIVMLMSVELMLNAVNVLFVSFSKVHQNLQGEVTVLFVITVAAAESAVGLGLLIALFRSIKSVDADQIQMLRD